jgi:hypothetical protein
MAVTDRTQRQEQTRPFWPGRARGLVKLPSPRCSRRAAVRPPSPEPPLRPPEVVQPRPGLARPDPDGAQRAQIWAGRTPPASPRRPTAKERPPRHLATRATPSRAPPPSEHREPESTAAGRGEPRATLTSSRVEARPPPPAPRGLSPVACADGGGGGGGGEGDAAAARDFAPTTARGGRCGALFRGRNRRLASQTCHLPPLVSKLQLQHACRPSPTDAASLYYGRRKVLELWAPLMVTVTYGSHAALRLLLSPPSMSTLPPGRTSALHCPASSGSSSSSAVEAVRLLQVPSGRQSPSTTAVRRAG